MLAALETHPDTSSLGHACPWDAELHGRPLLHLTLRAIAACPSIDRIAVMCPSDGEAPGFQRSLAALVRSAPVARDTSVAVSALPGRTGDIRRRIARRRRLAPDAWRAGWAIPYAIAEHVDPLRLLGLMSSQRVGDVAIFPGAAPCIDSGLVESVVAGWNGRREGAGLRLSTLPPGAATDIIGVQYLREVVEKGLGIDTALRFCPGLPDRDLDTSGIFHWFPEDRAALRHRLTGDSSRTLAVLQAVFDWANSRGVDPVGTPGWLGAFTGDPAYGSIMSGPVPAEVTVEITNRVRHSGELDDPGWATDPGQTREIDPELFGRLLEGLRRWQDVRLVLSGAEPTLHSRFEGLLEAARAAGVGSLVVETDGLGLERRHHDLLARCVDGVVVRVDAIDGETYRRLHGVDRLPEVEARVEELIAAGGEGEEFFVAVELRPTEETREQTVAFVDRWFEKTPWVLVRPVRDRCGQLDRRPVSTYRLPSRVPCVRIEDHMAVWADGTVTVCDNDIHRLRIAGDLARATVEDIWNGAELSTLRDAHARARWDAHPLCPTCDDWCRR